MSAELSKLMAHRQHGSDSCKELLRAADEALNREFSPHRSIRKLLRARANVIDEVLRRLWQQGHEHTREIVALIGTGGYGREELHPHSDIDLLILIDEQAASGYQEHVEGFVSLLWDLGVNISHSVRTVEESIALAEKDISVMTALMESRCIAGNRGVYRQMMKHITSDQLWPSMKFCAAKLEEQSKRHERYASDSYNLQPDIKNSPGGLREIQTLLWITRRHFGTKNLNHLVDNMFLTHAEVRLLRRGRDFLWRVRYLMHVYSGRCNDRLDFESQQRIAQDFDYRDTRNKLAVELFMGNYYRWVIQLGMISGLLVRHFEEHILLACTNQETRDVNARFRLCNNYIGVKKPDLFKNNPGALLEIFLLIAEHESIVGIRAATLRLLYRSRFLIDKSFRADKKNTRCFMSILKSGKDVGRVLALMSRYGILGRWLPEFAKVSGQMQHDLFHSYTVDAHLIEVVRNVNRLVREKMNSDMELPAEVAKQIPKPELLYAAGLYHDIAKGRGGDHSILGMSDAGSFARRHHLHNSEGQLLQWLVQHHLLMSLTAQKQDIMDPDVIRSFSEVVGNIERLNHLYVLTVADICATNPKLWNGWRASLLRQLYLNTRQALLRDDHTFIDRKQYLKSVKEQSMVLLKREKIPARKVKVLWDTLHSEYFIRETIDDIVWQTAGMVQHADSSPLVMIRNSSTPESTPTIQIFVYTYYKHNILSIVANLLEQNNLNVQHAHMIDTSSDYVLSSFVVLSREPLPPAEYAAYHRSIEQKIKSILQSEHPQLKAVRYLDKPEIKAFDIPLTIDMRQEDGKPYNTLEITTVDRYGLLSCLTQSISQLGLLLRGARITTIGERVDDVFHVTDKDGVVISDPARRAQLENSIRTDLESWVKTGTLN